MTKGHPGQKGAEDGVNADPLGEGRRQQPEGEGKTEHAAGPAGMSLNPGEQTVNHPGNHREHGGGEDQSEPEGVSQGHAAAGPQHTQNHGKNEPAQQIVENRRRHHRHA